MNPTKGVTSVKKVKWLAVVLILLMSASVLLIGCDEAMLEEMLEAQGFDEARWEELEQEMNALEDYAESLKESLWPEDQIAFEERLHEIMEEKFGDMETDLEERMAAIEADIEQQLDNEEITEAEAMVLMMEAMAGIFIDMLQFMEEAVPYMQEALAELAEEFDIDVTAIREFAPGAVLIVMAINDHFARVNEQLYTLEQPPVIQDGRTLVPLRFIGEALGASIDWDSDSRTVTYTTPDTKILLTIDNTTAFINGTPVEIEVAPTLVNGRTLVPARFVSEAMGFKTDWVSHSRQVVITSVQ